MQLKLVRTQRAGLTGANIFCLDARVEFTPSEDALVRKYKLQKEMLYASEAAQKHGAMAKAHFDDNTTSGNYRGAAAAILSRMALTITLGSLAKGQHVECKDMGELLAAEDAIMEGCKGIKNYLEAAATFDGREAVFDFSGEEPVLVTSSVPPKIAAPERDTRVPFEASPYVPLPSGGAPTPQARPIAVTSPAISMTHEDGAEIRSAVRKYGPFAVVVCVALYAIFVFVLHH